jgi:hypothetical protein
MRSQLVTQAVDTVPNRFVLMHATVKLTRAFHRRMQDRIPQTINDALAGMAAPPDWVHGKYVVLNMWELDEFSVPPDYKVVGYHIDLNWRSEVATPEQTVSAIEPKPVQPAPAEPAQLVETA